MHSPAIDSSATDPLSEILALLKPHNYMAGGFDLAGDWSFRFSHHTGIKCYAIVSGACWLVLDGEPPVRLNAGDCFLLPRGLPFTLASNLSLEPADAYTLFRIPLHGRIATLNGGGESFGVGGHFALSGSHARFLLNELPAVIHIHGETEKHELRSLIDRMRQEILARRPGFTLVAQQLSLLILLQALRLHLEDRLPQRAGWLSALADPEISPAIAAMHEAPSHPWTLQDLARRCGLSRSIFAARFKSTVALSAMDYLTRWRMLLAADRLLSTTHSIAHIAQSLGYDSQSAFTKAFRKQMTTTPTHYRQAQNSPVIPPQAAKETS
ncbi:MAG TPA: AraC family transcriptional regulator [Acidobacteriaceae bacterium]|jgi:AraC-like DNA-binding protein|nr:AraC family transcriptional regulator [Acidobacteriaceae bacterium]